MAPLSRFASGLTWLRGDSRFIQATLPADSVADGKLADLTGPGITDRWGVTSTDLGAAVVAPDGKLVAVFGDTFAGHRVGSGDWRSPVVLIGTGDAGTPIVWGRAAGPTPTTHGNCASTSTTTARPGAAGASAPCVHRICCASTTCSTSTSL